MAWTQRGGWPAKYLQRRDGPRQTDPEVALTAAVIASTTLTELDWRMRMRKKRKLVTALTRCHALIFVAQEAQLVMEKC